MKRLFWLGFGLFGLLVLVTAVQAEPAEPNTDPRVNTAVVQDACTGDNLLTNPSFEGQFNVYNPPGGHPSCIWGPCMTAQMADGWTPWWRIHNDNDPEYIFRMPEYKPAESFYTNPDRVRTGDRAQQYFTFYSTHEAGLRQQVSATPGETYCFSAWGHSWSAQDSGDAFSGPEDGQLFQKVGIDPTGGTDWTSPDIVWSDAGLGRIQYDVYGEFVVTAVAESPTITVFTYSQPRYAVKHNDVYWDDARLTKAQIVQAVALIPESGTTVMLTTPALATVNTAVFTIQASVPLNWQASLDSAGTILPTLNRTSGQAGDQLAITIQTAGLPLGTYTNRVTIHTDPILFGTPFEIPIHVVITDQISHAFLPLVSQSPPTP
ncbi:MAG: hypothetical protein KDD89_07265 [Anaerolineales bacterium]|nr:hypothetical protein [Anaerolineales bacterium]